jgi:hypothetical protein
LYPWIICWPLKLISRELGQKEEKGEGGRTFTEKETHADVVIISLNIASCKRGEVL